ncbi:hypothetical protein [uncultured Desulfuromusa sp.]|uniref:hypothetical protein n=1 Tax=uncultured Desulfuromusa sp. TaxID=219183 RepID=UPI002AA9422C|nr:hypothetical protein [uncultured Desulfuromusa sp.]
MSEIPTNTLIPIGVVLAALVTGAFSFINLVLSKEHQISQLRQQWIDALRVDISKYIASLVATEEIYSAMEENHGDDLDTLSRTIETKELHTDISTAYSNIIMRLNPEDKSEHQRTLRNLLLKSKSLGGAGKWEEAVEMVDSIRDSAQKTLKEEWEIVKRGEPSFVKSKRIALVVLFVTIISGVVVIYATYNHAPLEKNVEKQQQDKANKANQHGPAKG